MKRRLFLGVVSSVALLCVMEIMVEAKPRLTSPSPPAEWTVMIFMNADNNLEPYALMDFEEMAKVGSTDKVNLVVQFDRIDGWTSDSGNWTQTLRFRVEKGMSPLPERALQDLGEQDMGNGEVLGDFVAWAKDRYPAERYMLDVWDHGQGWRFTDLVRLLRDTATLAETASARKEEIRVAESMTIREKTRDFSVLASVASDSATESTLRSISNDDTSASKLFNREVQETLESVLRIDQGGEKLEVLGFDACLMSMVETAFAMRKVAKVMVASEELEPGYGWDYSLWLKSLADKPAMEGVELGRTLVSSYEKTYGAKAGDTTLSAIDLSRIEGLANSIDELAEALTLRLVIEPELQNIVRARQVCLPYAPGRGLHGIDLGRFCEKILTFSTDPLLRQRADATRSTLADLVLQNYAGKTRKPTYEFQYVGQKVGFGSHGLAIYFPESKLLFEADPIRNGYDESNTDNPVEFVQVHRWDNFLQAYFDRVHE
ncbi:MAG: clostripain-related cysteine peptidase [Pyrinomonadaceae bacterium]|nr:clostripain-related cysteine peptidase [Pyrinomonadaceae bacterium]